MENLALTCLPCFYSFLLPVFFPRNKLLQIIRNYHPSLQLVLGPFAALRGGKVGRRERAEMVFEDVTDEDKETESAFAKRERKKDDAHFLAGIRDIIAYICFLILYTVVIQTSGVEMAYPMASKMRDEVLGESFEEILVVDDVWNYLDSHFISTTFLEEGDDGLVEEMPSGRWGYILDVNRMIGAIQLQQKRVDVGGALPWNATPRSLP